jgi:hypothetical protein
MARSTGTGTVFPSTAAVCTRCFRLGGQPVNTGRQHRVNRVGHRHRRLWSALFHGVPRQLLQKERVAARFGHNLLEERLWWLRAPQDRLHDYPAVLGAQWR